MPVISITRDELKSRVIQDSGFNILKLKSDDMDQSNELLHFIAIYSKERLELITNLAIQIGSHSGVITDFINLAWSFAVPADETEFNLVWDDYKTETLNFYSHDGSTMNTFTVTVNEEPNASDVTNLSGICTIVDNS